MIVFLLFSDIDEEEEIVSFLTQFCKTNAIYIPARKAGEKLPKELVSFYHEVFSAIKEKLFRRPSLR